MGKGKHRIYGSEEKDATTKKYKDHIRKLENEITKLKSQLRTYDRAFTKNVMFLKEKTNDLTVEDLIAGAEKELTLKVIKDEKKDKFAEMERKWKCFQCNEGIMKLIIVPGIETNRYFRKCSMCVHRTEVKEYTEDVEGLK